MMRFAKTCTPRGMELMELSNDKIPECHDQLCHHCGYLGTEPQEVCDECGLQTHSECYSMLNDKCHVCDTDLPNDGALAEDPADRKEILRKMLCCALCQQEDPPPAYGDRSTDRLPLHVVGYGRTYELVKTPMSGEWWYLQNFTYHEASEEDDRAWLVEALRENPHRVFHEAAELFDHWNNVIIVSDTLQYRPLPLVVHSVCAASMYVLPAEVPFETHPEQWPGLLTMLYSEEKRKEMRFSNAHVPCDLAEVEVKHVESHSFQTNPCAFCGKQEGFTVCCMTHLLSPGHGCKDCNSTARKEDGEETDAQYTEVAFHPSCAVRAGMQRWTLRGKDGVTLFGLACNGTNTDSRKELLHKSFGSMDLHRAETCRKMPGFNELLLPEEGLHTQPMLDANTLYKVLPMKEEAPPVEKKPTRKKAEGKKPVKKEEKKKPRKKPSAGGEAAAPPKKKVKKEAVDRVQITDEKVTAFAVKIVDGLWPWEKKVQEEQAEEVEERHETEEEVSYGAMMNGDQDDNNAEGQMGEAGATTEDGDDPPVIEANEATSQDDGAVVLDASAVHPVPSSPINAEQVGPSHGGGEGEEEQAEEVEDEHDDEEEMEEEEEEETAPAKKIILYSATQTYANKRPIMHVLDAEADPDELSSRKIKKCRWVKFAPPSVMNIDFTPNKAVTSLRDAMKPSDKVMGCSGVNKNVALCMSAEGPKLLLKAVIEAKKLRTYLKD